VLKDFACTTPTFYKSNVTKHNTHTDYKYVLLLHAFTGVFLLKKATLQNIKKTYTLCAFLTNLNFSFLKYIKVSNTLYSIDQSTIFKYNVHFQQMYNFSFLKYTSTFPTHYTALIKVRSHYLKRYKTWTELPKFNFNQFKVNKLICFQITVLWLRIFLIKKFELKFIWS
jgi:hypothetical protein